MPRQRRPDPPPMKTNDTLVAVTGTVAFAVASFVLLIVPLDAADRWWRWVGLTGFVMGLFACWYVPHLQRSRAAAEARRAAARSAGDDGADAPPAPGSERSM